MTNLRINGSQAEFEDRPSEPTATFGKQQTDALTEPNTNPAYLLQFSHPLCKKNDDHLQQRRPAKGQTLIVRRFAGRTGKIIRISGIHNCLNYCVFYSIST